MALSKNKSLKTFCLLIKVPDQKLSGRHRQPFVQFHPDQREVPATHKKSEKNQQKIRKTKKTCFFAWALSFMY
jgi:hypothetical protein